MDKRRKTLKDCIETSYDKCIACSKCWVGCVLSLDDSMTKCSGCNATSPVTDKSKPCPNCGACGSLAWMEEVVK